MLPIVPAYLPLITGLDITSVGDGARHQLGRVARDTAVFIAGFSAVFVLLGLGAPTIGRTVFRNQVVLLGSLRTAPTWPSARCRKSWGTATSTAC